MAGPAAAQVNTERLRLGQSEEGWSGFVALRLAAKEGNTDRLAAGLGFRVQYAEPEPGERSDDLPSLDPLMKRLVFLVAEGDYAEESGERSEYRSFAHLRWVERRSPKLAHEVFLQNEFNEFQRLDSRYLLGFGERITLLRKPSREVFLGLGLMGEAERLDVPDVGPDERTSEFVRASTYLAAQMKLGSKGATVVNTLYYQPRVDRWDDFRILEELDLRVPLAEHLELSLAIVVQHDSEAPEDVEEWDLSVTNALRVRF
ncbi:MAG: DUF481 domain-containing protein [Acidobacteriota bacterium]